MKHDQPLLLILRMDASWSLCHVMQATIWVCVSVKAVLQGGLSFVLLCFMEVGGEMTRGPPVAASQVSEHEG